MVRDYAIETVEECLNHPRVKAEWCNEYVNTKKYAVMRLLCVFSLRHESQRKLLESIFDAYGMPMSFEVQANKAEELFLTTGRAPERLAYIGSELAAKLAIKIVGQDLEKFYNLLPEKA